MSVVPLDDLAAVAAADPADMLGAVIALPDHAQAGYATGLAATELPSADDVRSIIFLGMGGSAVAGDIARALYAPRLGVSLETVRSPRLPEYVQQHALVIATSFSGNTAETLASFEEAVERGARVVAITGGGQLAMRAEQEHVPIVPVPGGLQPRAALGYLAFTTLGVLEAFGLIPPLRGDVEETLRVLRGMAGELAPSQPGNEAKRLALAIGARSPVIWGTDGLGTTAAMRWKTQLNENGKLPAWSSAMSELDHNEIVGWHGKAGEDYHLVTLRHALEDPSIEPRFALTVELAASSGLAHTEVSARGASPLAQLLSLIYMGDFVSVYAGIARGIDPTPVHLIDKLKAALT